MIEVVLTLTLTAIVMGFLLGYYRTSQIRASINTEASSMIAYIRLIQSNTSSGLDNSVHGIHLEQESYTSFLGDTYNPLDVKNFTISLPPTVVIQNINLNGGGSDIVFSRPFGETNTYGTFELSTIDAIKTIPISITNIGTISY